MKSPSSIVITGATGAIGSALAEIYATPGISLLLQGRNAIRLAEIAALCEAKGAQVSTYVLDLSDIHALNHWLDELKNREPLDLVIANAGLNSHTGPDGAMEHWTEVEALLAVNVRSTIALIHAVVPGMRLRGNGQIAIISSLAAYFGLPAAPTYCASKAALKAYGEALRGLLGPIGIQVNVVMPGYVESPMCRAMPGPKPFLWSASRAAQKIRIGLEKDQARISFPFPLNLGTWFLSTTFPSFAQWILKWVGYGY